MLSKAMENVLTAAKREGVLAVKDGLKGASERVDLAVPVSHVLRDELGLDLGDGNERMFADVGGWFS